MHHTLVADVMCLQVLNRHHATGGVDRRAQTAYEASDHTTVHPTRNTTTTAHRSSTQLRHIEAAHIQASSRLRTLDSTSHISATCTLSHHTQSNRRQRYYFNITAPPPTRPSATQSHTRNIDTRRFVSHTRRDSTRTHTASS